MKSKLLIGGLAVLGLILAYVIFKTLIPAIAGGIAGGIAGAVAAKFLIDRDREAQSAPQAPEAPKDPTIELLQGLVKLNVSVRENALPMDAITVCERIIDKLRELVPEMNENYRGNDLTWEVNQAASDYLFRIVDPYARLSADERAAHLEEFLEGAGKLEQALDEVSQVVRSHKQGDFSAKAKFLNARFARS